MKTNKAHPIYIIKTELDTIVIDLTHLMFITEFYNYNSKYYNGNGNDEQYYNIILIGGNSYSVCNSLSPKENLINAWIKSKQI